MHIAQRLGQVIVWQRNDTDCHISIIDSQ